MAASSRANRDWRVMGTSCAGWSELIELRYHHAQARGLLPIDVNINRDSAAEAPCDSDAERSR